MSLTSRRSRLPGEESFLKDVAGHEMTVFRDDGLYRHLRFRSPKTWACGFDVTTWPGLLCFSGDMGCYVFSRAPDMIEFFRGGDAAGPLHINPSYWGEKVEAIDRNGPLEEYSPDIFKEAIGRWMEDGEWPQDAREDVACEVLSRAEDGEHEAMRAALDYGRGNHRFDCFYEVSVREISYRFLWCCYALAWAVRQYDTIKGQAK